MKWNNGREHKLFEKQQAELREQYIAAGMTEEQMQAMYDLDKSIHNGKRREAIHTQRLDLCELDNEADEGQNPLLEKFESALSVELDLSVVSRLAWIEDISDERLVIALRSLDTEELELLTAVWIEGYTVEEMSQKLGIHKSNVSRRLKRIKGKILKFF